MYEARDAMTRNIIPVSPDDTVEAAIRTLVEHQISGAPVVDKDGTLVGLISEYQLLEIAYDPHIKESKVRDFMTKEVLTVNSRTLLTTVANLFVSHRIRRVPVLEEGRLVGIISRRDILRYMTETGKPIDRFFSEMRSFVSPAEPPSAAAAAASM
jgi:CBS domain-containing protein